mmetsp:Transcript_8910/g.13378  ORF Transcript_8910/g.13378 Transcript_8910/m.13378 type:complete len:586 (-) Transcript_8910:154-1911(-)
MTDCWTTKYDMDVWNSRRSTVYSTKGMCACTQPLAASIGRSVLESGGGAADAAVAMAAALNIIEPCSTGIGGDAFALYYDASTREVSCFMGNGAAPEGLSLDVLDSRGIGVQPSQLPLDPHSGLCITVPGAASLWEDVVLSKGRKSLGDVLAPAIALGEEGFVLGPVTASQWAGGFLQGEEAMKVFRPDGRPPAAGEVVYNRDLARTFRELSEKGAKEGFYKGRIADAIVQASTSFGGVLSSSDLAAHRTDILNPSSTVYKGYRVYETPPPTHGIAALMALNVMEELYPDQMDGTPETRRGSVAQAHAGIEAMRLAFADALQHISDPEQVEVPVDVLLSKAYAKERAKLVHTSPAFSNAAIGAGDPSNPYVTSETVYFCVVDGQGNACSMINSNYMGFGTGIVPEGCGFTLQNRAHNFSLKRGHPNAVAPFKKPYHTIIPALVTNESDGSLYATLGVMGGFMQPQGHLQVLRNLVDFGMDPQSALDAPRWCLAYVGNTQDPQDVKTSNVFIEHCYGGRGDGGDDKDEGETLVQELQSLGHNVITIKKGSARSVFGRGQVIKRSPEGVLAGGSDPRSDGCAIPCIK